MTVAVSRAKGAGAEAVICASTGNTAASAAAYAARAGHARRRDRARGQDRDRQARPGADARRPRDRAARATSTRRCGSSASSPSSHPIELVNSVNPYRIEGQKTAAFEVDRGARRGARRARDPGRQRRQRHRLVAGLPGARTPRRSSTASRPRAPRRWSTAPRSRTPRRRLGDPHRQPGPLGGGDERLHRLPRPRRRRHRRADPRRLPLARRATRASSASRPRPPRSPASSPTACPSSRAPSQPETVVCVLTGHGLKDPDTALGKAPAVISCDNDLAAVERAVFD